ncbi:MAG: response regulator [Lachnospiraceae bacterium]|jgi:two-component system response regulator YesN|nr:response regulator [Lachnospiraceae bacterium]
MYRILLADDEGIMLESLKTIILSNFADECMIATAKTGRTVIEQAEEFRPDIVFMDIQMPGINGIDAIREIQKFNTSAIFIVVTAYDKFDYAKNALSLGVLDYLTKPVSKKTIIDVLIKAMRQVDAEKEKRSENLKIKEKFDSVVPMIESGLVNTLLFQEKDPQTANEYKSLLEIRQDYGFVIIVEFGAWSEDGTFENAVGMSVKAQTFYPEFREIVKGFFECIVGPIMGNKIVLLVPAGDSEFTYDERAQIVERSRNMMHKLDSRIDVKFKAGIGDIKPFVELRDSYEEALKSLAGAGTRVAQFQDVPNKPYYEENYPKDVEDELFRCIEKADMTGTKNAGNAFFDWMVTTYGSHIDDIRLKCLEFVMHAERQVFTKGVLQYSFLYRKDYLKAVTEAPDMETLRAWYISKLTQACTNIAVKPKAMTDSAVSKAKKYIDENYRKDLSLDEVSKIVNISPYYFSKLFKEETGENFIEYVTEARIRGAKELLADPGISIKEVCAMSGYSDPNYFSRIFKKYEGVTPSEYRENMK